MSQRRRWIIIAVIIITLAVWAAIFGFRQKSTLPTSTPTPLESVTPTITPTPTSTLNASTPAQTTPTPTASSTPSISHAQKASTAYQSKDYETAITEYTAAIKEESNTSTLALLWNSLGNVYRDSGNSTTALTAYSSSIQYNPKNGEAYLNKAALQWSIGKRDEAKATLRDGIQKEATRKQDLQNTLSVYESLPR